ncbi:MAG: transposase [Kiritimatiellae bacterium]|nr:transposase [Kiritimatiellia bacterium]
MGLGLRNKNINYDEGWFFVTFQVAQNKSLLGAIVEEQCILNELGNAIEKNIQKLPQIYKNVYIDKHVVMPNHIHMIVKLSGSGSGGRAPDPRYNVGVGYRSSSNSAGLGHCSSNTVGLGLSPSSNIVGLGLCPSSNIVGLGLRPQTQTKNLSQIIGGFKSYTSNIYLKLKKQNKCPDIGAKLWQSSYYDVLISNHQKLENIRNYIENNPRNWEQDRFGSVTQFSLGNIELLNEPLTAFVASEGLNDGKMQCIKKGFEKDSAQKNNPVISTFSSYEERCVLNKCLAHKRPIIKVCPGGIPSNLEQNLKQAVDENRCLLISPIGAEVGINKQRANVCNFYVLKNAEEIWTGHIRPGGSLESILKGISL